jgi:hypothetical protein
MKIWHLVSEPKRALLGQLTLYYALLAVGTMLVYRVPAISQYLLGSELTPAAPDATNLLAPTDGLAFRVRHARAAIALLISIVGALCLMIPVTWVYLGTRRRRGLDQSMVENLLVLPIAVAGVVSIVQDSLALAFSLAGIFAGIQFRSRLKMYADAPFIFMAIGVGLAAGIQALHIAAVMSASFCYVLYALWRLNYGMEAGARHLRYSSDAARTSATLRKEAHQHEKQAQHHQQEALRLHEAAHAGQEMTANGEEPETASNEPQN